MGLLMKRLHERAGEKNEVMHFMIPAWLVKSVEKLDIQETIA
jgi:hypothetical protein